ncbi:hypothetical protein LOC54_02435 [Acetobacter sp. AN02]|uniref:hypothetical protein n=1 Tax=Acetobacter sp. AN02 TaxID=2894186 RepID=UPI0024343605|nr:hypothetical protein [Acetobacter sp. AN02]MDG6093980.1 hypothetical protein [Acetobacter sp. AN02]
MFEDGRVIPCCNTIVSLRTRAHPLDFGNILLDSPEQTTRREQENTLWAAIKSLGFDWLREQLVAHDSRFETYWPLSTCDFCFDVCQDGPVRSAIQDILAQPQTALFIHALLAREYNHDTSRNMLPELARACLRQTAGADSTPRTHPELTP